MVYKKISLKSESHSPLLRYTDIKEDIAEELENLRDEGKALENVSEIFLNFLRVKIFLQELPKRISTAEEKEILSLLLKVHELEIDKVLFVLFVRKCNDMKYLSNCNSNLTRWK